MFSCPGRRGFTHLPSYLGSSSYLGQLFSIWTLWLRVNSVKARQSEHAWALLPRLGEWPSFLHKQSPSRNSSNGDGDGNENDKNSDRFILAKQQLCTSITLFCTFLFRRCRSTTWNLLNSGFVEDVRTCRGREHKAVMISLCYFFSNASRDQSINSYETVTSWSRPGALMIADLKLFDVALSPVQADATFNNEC